MSEETNQHAWELEALADYHEASGEPFTPEAMRQLARKWRATVITKVTPPPMPEVGDRVALRWIAPMERLKAAGVEPGYRFFHSAGDFAGRECVLQRSGAWGIDVDPTEPDGRARGFCSLAHPICTCGAIEVSAVAQHLKPCDLYYEERGETPGQPVWERQIEKVYMPGEDRPTTLDTAEWTPIPTHAPDPNCEYLATDRGCYWCCEVCNTGGHTCPGCGDSTTHRKSVCDDCMEEARAH